MLFHRVSIFAVQMFCMMLFCFVFLAHLTHGSSSVTPTLTPSPTTVTELPIIASDVVKVTSTVNSTSVNTTKPAVTSTAFPIHSPIIPSIKPAITTAKQMSKDTGRKFDGLSFFGGVILGAVICVVLLFSVKYYQAKKRSYHSL